MVRYSFERFITGYLQSKVVFAAGSQKSSLLIWLVCQSDVSTTFKCAVVTERCAGRLKILVQVKLGYEKEVV